MNRAATPPRGPVLLVVAVLLGALAGTWLGLVQGVHGRASEAAPAAAAPPTHASRAASASKAVTSTSRTAGTVTAAQRRGTPRRAPGRDTGGGKPDQRAPVGPGQHGHGHDRPKPHQARD